MYTGLLHLHSFSRYIVLILIVITAFRSLVFWVLNNHYTRTDEKLGLFSMIGAHLQLVIGLVLYFLSPLVQYSNMGGAMKDPVLRFWTVEHIAMMLIAIVLVTIGRSTAKRARSDIMKHKRVALFFLIALVIIFVSIPWPFLRESVARGWF